MASIDKFHPVLMAAALLQTSNHSQHPVSVWIPKSGNAMGTAHIGTKFLAKGAVSTLVLPTNKASRYPVFEGYLTIAEQAFQNWPLEVVPGPRRHPSKGHGTCSRGIDRATQAAGAIMAC